MGERQKAAGVLIMNLIWIIPLVIVVIHLIKDIIAVIWYKP